MPTKIDRPISYSSGLGQNRTQVKNDRKTLCLSDGTATADQVGDGLIGVWLYNQGRNPDGTFPRQPTNPEIRRGRVAVTTGVNWHCNHNDPAPVIDVKTEANPNSDNNRLFVLSVWKRDDGSGFLEIFQRGDPMTYAAQSCNACP